MVSHLDYSPLMTGVNPHSRGTKLSHLRAVPVASGLFLSAARHVAGPP